MSIIIRLQNLPWAANSVDIRRFFAGLSIPEGGVHIVGGEKGDAFIAFSTDEDARQAMEKDGGKVKDMRVKLLLSSRTEMMRVIEQARNHNLTVQGSSSSSSAPVIKASAADSDRRKIIDHGSSPRRREREKSPSRDRGGSGSSRRSSSRRDRSRSRSRSPSRRSRDKERDRDIDRRVDRSKRDERRFNDGPRVRDERYKNSRESENRDSDSSRSGFQFDPQQQNMISVNQPHFDPRIPALSTSGNMYNYASEMTPTNVQTEKFEAKMVTDRAGEHFYGANSGMQMEKRLMSPNQPNSSSIPYEDQRPPIMSLLPGIGFEKSTGQAQSNTFPKGVPPNMNMYNKMTGNQARDTAFEKSFGLNTQPVGNQPPYNTASERVSAPSVPYDRNSISSGQPLSSTAAYPPKPAYGTEPPVAYEQPSVPHQASRSAGSPIRRQSPTNQHNESGLYGKRLPPNIPTVTPSPGNFNKPPLSRRTQPSRFEPEFSSREVPFYSGNNNDGVGRSPNVPFGRTMPENKEDSRNQYDKLSNQPRVMHEEVTHGPPRNRNLNRIEEPQWQKQQLTRPEPGSWNEGRQGLLEPPSLPSAKNINFEQSNTVPKFPTDSIARAKVPDRTLNQGPVPSGNFRPPPEGQFPAENISKTKGPERSINQGPLPSGNFRPSSDGHPQDRRRPLPGPPYARPENQGLSEGYDGPPPGKGKRDPLIREPRNMGPLLERNEPPPNKMSHGPPSLAVEVRGLPYDACEADVLELFRGIFLPPGNLKLQYDNHERPTGNAFVKFKNQHDFEVGLSRHRQYIGNSCPEVVACPSAVFENAPVLDHLAKKQRPPQPIRRKGRPREEDLCVQLRGLPYSCKDDDIVRFFDGLRILDIMIDRAPDGRALGTGFVEFGTPDDLQASLAMNGKMIGHRYINISVASKEMMSSGNEKFPDQSPDQPSFDKGPPIRERMPPPPHSRDDMRPPFHSGPPSGPSPYCVVLGGLPEISNNAHIAGFFSEVDVIPQAIHIMIGPGKIPTGEAFAEFNGMRDFEIALQKNNKFLSGVPVSVTPIPYWEMVDILGGPPSGPTPPPALLKNPPMDERPPRRPLMKLPPAPMDENSMEESMHIDELEHRAGPDSFPHGRPLLEPNFRPKDMPPFDVMEPSMRGRPPFLRPRGAGGPIRGNARHPRPFGSDHPPRAPGPFRQRPQRPPPGAPPSQIGRGPHNFGSPGCVVAISNLHFNAGLEELLDFFHGYSLTKDNVIRKYNGGGKATGEARVSFRCPEDAMKAVEELSQKPILGRPICLSLV